VTWNVLLFLFFFLAPDGVIGVASAFIDVDFVVVGVSATEACFEPFGAGAEVTAFFEPFFFGAATCMA
jgi:hypothetical protein